MTARKDLDSYPPQFQQLTERCLGIMEAGPKPEDGVFFRVKMGTGGRAVNLMMQLRQYWKALIFAAPGLKDYDPRKELGTHCSILACRAMKGFPETIEVFARTSLAGAKEIEEAMAELPPLMDKIQFTTTATPKAKKGKADALDSVIAGAYGETAKK